MQTVPVNLGDRSYSIQIGMGLIEQIGALAKPFQKTARCAVITDTKVAPLYARKVTDSLTAAGFQPVVVKIPAGEPAKSLSIVEECYSTFARERLERKSIVFALGGGVVGDLAGFAAATYLRGLPFIQIPTTLLAQVDSSVGGKVGINLPAGKNLVGAFHQPKLVVCDLGSLKTLSVRQFRAGMAEVIKYGIIYDAALFEFVEKKFKSLMAYDSAALHHIVARSCEIKATVVSQDETETGLRAVLNFGHTIGHGIEAITGYGKLLHGEAISIGQVAAAEIGKISGLSTREIKRIEKLFQLYQLPTKRAFNPDALEKLFAAMKLDKKVSSGELKFVLAKKIGEVVYGQSVPEETIRSILG